MITAQWNGGFQYISIVFVKKREFLRSCSDKESEFEWIFWSPLLLQHLESIEEAAEYVIFYMHHSSNER